MIRPFLLCLAFSWALAACKQPPHSHEGEAGHPHGHEHGQAPAGEPERPDVSVTLYEGGLELFMEYPALVVGQPSPLVAHFTDVRDPEGFKVVTKGRVTATLRYADATEERFVAETLLRDGIFKPVVRPTKAGEATLTLRLDGEQVAGTVGVGPVTVHPTVAAAVAAAPPEEAGEATVPFSRSNSGRRGTPRRWPRRVSSREAFAPMAS